MNTIEELEANISFSLDVLDLCKNLDQSSKEWWSNWLERVTTDYLVLKAKQGI